MQAENDGFKWFGEGFNGFPKRLPDDCVEYAIYIIPDRYSSTAVSSATQIRSRLNEILKFTNHLKKKYLQEYIWQRDEFQLSIQHGSIKDEPQRDTNAWLSIPAHLRGRTNFGDSVADEWVVVFLLREISRSFPDAWIRMYDTDGEFLLIEAANTLPKWLNPEIADHRVWLNDGHLKIIPLDQANAKSTSPSSSQNLTLSSALHFLSSSPQTLLIDPTIEAAAFQRISNHPDAIASSLHHSRVVIPRNLAWLLHRQPAYISPAIEAFYLRDPISLRPLSTKDLSTLKFSPEDLVSTNVTFTKVGFAQLRGQIFSVPPAWVGVAPRVARDEKTSMGMKLACGMEMLLSDPQKQDTRVVREIKLLLEDVECGEETLPDDAKLAEWNAGKEEDDEKWLDVDYGDFERELDGTAGESAKGTGFGDQAAQENLRKMVQRFKEFVADDDAGVDGVDDFDDDDDETDDETDDDSEMLTEPEATPSDPSTNTQSTQAGVTNKQAETTSQDEDEEELNPPNPHQSQPSTSSTTQPIPDWSSHLAGVEFEKAISDVRGMSNADIESSGLLSEARRLALAESWGSSDDESSSSDNDDDNSSSRKRGQHKDLQQMMALLEQKLHDRKASPSTKDGPPQDNKIQATKPFFGPERPPHLQPAPQSGSGSIGSKSKSKLPSNLQEITRSGHRASNDNGSDDEDEDEDEEEEEDYTKITSLDDDDDDDDNEYNDIDINLARNLLSSIKGGNAGVSSNFLRALGMPAGLPLDSDDALRRGSDAGPSGSAAGSTSKKRVS